MGLGTPATGGLASLPGTMLDVLSNLGSIPPPSEQKRGKIVDANMQGTINQILSAFGLGLPFGMMGLPTQLPMGGTMPMPFGSPLNQLGSLLYPPVNQ